MKQNKTNLQFILDKIDYKIITIMILVVVIFYMGNRIVSLKNDIENCKFGLELNFNQSNSYKTLLEESKRLNEQQQHLQDSLYQVIKTRSTNIKKIDEKIKADRKKYRNDIYTWRYLDDDSKAIFISTELSKMDTVGD